MLTWKLWTGLPHVALWESVALVLDLDPRSLRPSKHGWMVGPGRGPLFDPRSFPSPDKLQRFDEALDFAEKAANYAGPIHLRIGLASGMNKRTAQVSLSEVVAFFVGVEWPDIPPPLLALVTQGASDAQAREAPVQPPAPAAIVGITEAVRPLTTAQVADAFDGELELSAAQWRERLGDMPLWLLPARAAKGKAPNPSTWWPLEFARILLERGATFDSLNRKFLAVPALKPWLPAWQEQRRERNAFGQ